MTPRKVRKMWWVDQDLHIIYENDEHRIFNNAHVIEKEPNVIIGDFEDAYIIEKEPYIYNNLKILDPLVIIIDGIVTGYVKSWWEPIDKKKS